MNLINTASGLFVMLAREDLAGADSGFSFDTEGAVFVFRVILAIAVGAVIAAMVSVYDKRYLGSFVRKLADEGCNSSENAKTLYELGFDDKLGVRYAIRRGYVYSRFVVCVEEEEYKKAQNLKREEFLKAHEDEKKPPKFKEIPFSADIDTAHYYVPEDKRDIALIKFSAKGSNWMGILIVLIVIAVMLGLTVIFLPKIWGLAGLLLS